MLIHFSGPITVTGVDYSAQLIRLEALLQQLLHEVEHIMAHLDPLIAKVTKIETATDSILELVHGMAEQLREHMNEPAVIEELANRLDAKAEAIAAAVLANTPTAPQ